MTEEELRGATDALKAFRQQAFLAALQGSLAGDEWKPGPWPWSAHTELIRCCWDIADAAVKANKEPFA